MGAPRLTGPAGIRPVSPRDTGPRPETACRVEGRSRRGSIRLSGAVPRALVDEAFSKTWTEKTLAEVTPASLRPAVISASDQCAQTGCAIYTILRTYNDAGYPVDLERLLLPFGKSGRAQIIVASLQLISMEGMFERAKVVEYFEARADFMVSLRISAASFNEARARSVDVTMSSPEGGRVVSFAERRGR